MKIATTTEEFNRFHKTYIDKVKELYSLGFKYIDISFYDQYKNGSEIMSENWRDTVAKLKEFSQATGVKYVQSHLPGHNPLNESENTDYEHMSNIRTIEICGELGIKNAVFHCGFKKDIGKKEFFELNKEYIQLLTPYLEKHNVNLCIENSCKSNLGKYYYFFDGKEMREFIEYINHPNITACWDTGHANIEGHQYEDIIALGEKLTALHINDNRGEKDEHILPYTGTMNIDEVMTALTEINFKGYFTFESGNAIIFTNSWPYKRPIFEKNQKSNTPDIICKRIFVQAQLEIGKKILTDYNCYED